MAIQKARIRTRWKAKDRAVTLEEYAAAVAAVAWRVALNAAKNLHEQDFVYDTDRQRLGVIQEYLFFFIHVADRVTIEDFDGDDRTRFLTHLASQCRRHLAENEKAISNQASLSDGFINTLNQRLDGYCQTPFEGDQPGYSCYRKLGSGVLDFMGESQTNRWVQEQVMDIDGPEAWSVYRKAIRDIGKSAAG